MKRLGALKGSGKKGYYNFMPKDPKIHGDSAKGIKQPQKLPYVAKVQMTARGIGKAHTDKVPNVKIKQIGGDINWQEYGGQFIVDEKFNNGEFDYYLVIQFTNLPDAIGDEAEHEYMIQINSVAPSQVSEKDLQRAFKSMGADDKEQKRLRKDPKALAGLLSEYGLNAPMFNETGDDAEKLMDEAKKQIPAITTMFGFYMDRRVNAIGNSGWDYIKGDIGFKK